MNLCQVKKSHDIMCKNRGTPINGFYKGLNLFFCHIFYINYVRWFAEFDRLSEVTPKIPEVILVFEKPYILTPCLIEEAKGNFRIEITIVVFFNQTDCHKCIQKPFGCLYVCIELCCNFSRRFNLCTYNRE